MKSSIFRFLNLLALMACVAWLAKDPGWDSLAGTLAFFATLIGYEINLERKRHDNPDLVLFKEFLATLPSNGDMEYVHNQHMAGIIDSSRFRSISRFRREWANAEHEFLNKKLEHGRHNLNNAIDAFLEYFGLNTWNVRDDFQRIPPEWQETDPERYRQTERRLNQLADALYNAHQELVRLGRQVLRSSSGE